MNLELEQSTQRYFPKSTPAGSIAPHFRFFLLRGACEIPVKLRYSSNLGPRIVCALRQIAPWRKYPFGVEEIPHSRVLERDIIVNYNSTTTRTRTRRRRRGTYIMVAIYSATWTLLYSFLRGEFELFYKHTVLGSSP